MSEKIDRKIKGNYNVVFVVLVCDFVALLLGISEYGFQENIFKGALLILVFVLFLFLVAYFSSLTITTDKRLICKRPFEWGFDIDIGDITKIDRSSVFMMRRWGNRLQIHYKNDYADDNWQTVRESNYSVKNIKLLLKRLKEINPSIKLHPQYQDLIDGKIKDSNSFKHEDIEGIIE